MQGVIAANWLRHARWAIVTLACLWATSARADVLYGVTFSNQLITINPATGASTLVGNLDSTMQPLGIAVNGGLLYTYDQVADLVRQIDPATGHTVASFNIGAGNLTGEGDLAFRSDGAGFISSGPTSLPGNGLIGFHLTPASSSIIGTLSPFMDGLAFDRRDVLYGLSQGAPTVGSALYTINTTTAATTLVGGLSVPGDTSENLGALTFRSDGTLFAALSDDTTFTNLYTVDVNTGKATLVGAISGFTPQHFDVSGLAFLPSVPEPSAALLSVVGAAALALRWRFKRACRAA